MSEKDEGKRAERKEPVLDEARYRKVKRSPNMDARAAVEQERALARPWRRRWQDRDAERKELAKIKCPCGHRGDKHRPIMIDDPSKPANSGYVIDSAFYYCFICRSDVGGCKKTKLIRGTEG